MGVRRTGQQFIGDQTEHRGDRDLERARVPATAHDRGYIAVLEDVTAQRFARLPVEPRVVGVGPGLNCSIQSRRALCPRRSRLEVLAHFLPLPEMRAALLTRSAP